MKIPETHGNYRYRRPCRQCRSRPSGRSDETPSPEASRCYGSSPAPAGLCAAGGGALPGASQCHTPGRLPSARRTSQVRSRLGGSYGRVGPRTHGSLQPPSERSLRGWVGALCYCTRARGDSLLVPQASRLRYARARCPRHGQLKDPHARGDSLLVPQASRLRYARASPEGPFRGCPRHGQLKDPRARGDSIAKPRRSR